MPWFCSFRDAYFRNKDDAHNIYVSPLLADLAGTPPAYVMTCESDTLRDEGKAYADKLTASGVQCEYINVHGLDHGFIDLNKHQVPAIAQYQDAVFAAIKNGLC